MSRQPAVSTILQMEPRNPTVYREQALRAAFSVERLVKAVEHLLQDLHDGEFGYLSEDEVYEALAQVKGESL